MNEKLKLLKAAVVDLKLAIRVYLILGDVSVQLCHYLLKLIDIIDTLNDGNDPTEEVQDLAYRIMDVVARSVLERVTQVLKTKKDVGLLIAQGQLTGCLSLVNDGHTKDSAFAALASSVEQSLRAISAITDIKYPEISLLR